MPVLHLRVFTDTRFGGNQLAVVPEAEGLSAEDMQRITREFDFSESTFVLPAEQGNRPVFSLRRGRGSCQWRSTSGNRPPCGVSSSLPSRSPWDRPSA
ncbi:MAG TPA: hypothetical protein DIC52_06745 [Candidatus Latescibacteria bacterium]|nr:hypothetical protein [Candidatus Latescibacterota bacterium]